jgi:hypothetical protein
LHQQCHWRAWVSKRIEKIKKGIRRGWVKQNLNLVFTVMACTKIKSADFKYRWSYLFNSSLHDNEGNEKYKLLVTFPHKKSSCCLNCKYNGIVDYFLH